MCIWSPFRYSTHKWFVALFMGLCKFCTLDRIKNFTVWCKIWKNPRRICVKSYISQYWQFKMRQLQIVYTLFPSLSLFPLPIMKCENFTLKEFKLHSTCMVIGWQIDTACDCPTERKRFRNILPARLSFSVCKEKKLHTITLQIVSPYVSAYVCICCAKKENSRCIWNNNDNNDEYFYTNICI